MQIERFIRSFFSFSRSQARGLIVLLLLLSVLLSVRYILYKRQEEYNLLIYHTADTITDITNSGFQYSDHEVSKHKPSGLNSEIIDPNSATYSQLVSIGFSSSAARNLIKFREHGAIIRTPDDLFKVYGFDSVQYKNSMANLRFSFTDHSGSEAQILKEKPFKIELNSSDSLTLIRLPGIGPVLAARIIRYRKLLGGYYSINQIREVYGIHDSIFPVLSDHLIVDSLRIVKIDLNTSTLKELEQHPYITKYQAKAILSYRRLIGSFTSLNQLVINYLISENEYARVAPYLHIDQTEFQ